MVYTDRMERSEAKALGLVRYTTGRACKHGHVGDRNTSDGVCLDCSRLKVRGWQRANPEKHRANRQKWRSGNPEKVKAQLKRQYDKNPGKYKAAAKEYEVRKQQAIPPWADLEAIRAFYAACPVGYHVDHHYPLNGRTSCGLHVLANLRYLPAAENLRKSNRLPE
jgi:hypothetical protein